MTKTIIIYRNYIYASEESCLFWSCTFPSKLKILCFCFLCIIDICCLCGCPSVAVTFSSAVSYQFFLIITMCFNVHQQSLFFSENHIFWILRQPSELITAIFAASADVFLIKQQQNFAIIDFVVLVPRKSSFSS